MIVVDTNVLVHLSIEGDKSPLARAVREQDPVWILPPLWKHDYLNVLPTYGKTSRISISELRSIWKQAVQVFQPLERPVDYAEALRLAMELSISGCDAQYLAHPTGLGIPLITEDKALLKVSSERAMSMKQFCEA